MGYFVDWAYSRHKLHKKYSFQIFNRICYQNSSWALSELAAKMA